MPGQRPRSRGSTDSRRAAMCRAAAQIFRDRGFDATSVSDIARALGLTKAGLYHHFESKEALLFEIMSFGTQRSDANCQRIRNAQTSSSWIARFSTKRRVGLMRAGAWRQRLAPDATPATARVEAVVSVISRPTQF